MAGKGHCPRQIARVLCDRRKLAPIETTAQLVDVIDAAIPKKVRARDGSHPARRTFQALRIAVNDELKPLEQALDDFHLPELTYFREHFLPSFRLTLDEME